MAERNAEEFFFHIRHMPIYFDEGKLAPILGYRMVNLSRRRAHTQ